MKLHSGKLLLKTYIQNLKTHLISVTTKRTMCTYTGYFVSRVLNGFHCFLFDLAWRYLHKITNLWTLNSIGRWSCERIMDEQIKKLRAPYKIPWIRDLSWGLEIYSNILVRKNVFLKNYVTEEGTVFHNVLYLSRAPISRINKEYFVHFFLGNYQ